MTGNKVAAVLLIALGSALSLVGLMAGFTPHTLGDISCGSAFAPAEFITYSSCFTTLDSSRSLAFMLLVPGMLAVGVGFILVLASAGGAFRGMFHQPTLAELEARNADA